MREQDAGRAQEEWHDDDVHELLQSMAVAMLTTGMIRHVLCLRQGALALQDAITT